MVDSINCRPLQAEDVLSQREMFSACFPETVGSPCYGDSYRKWKFGEIPSTPPSFEFIAETNGKLIGYYAALPLEYRVQDRRARVALVVDVMVHPQSQGQGVFRHLGSFSCNQLKLAGFDFTTGYPIRPQVMPGHIKVGWQIAFPLPTFVSVFSSKSILRSLKLEILYLILEPFVRVQAWIIDMILKVMSGNFQCEMVPALSLVDAPDFWEFQSRWSEKQIIAWARTPTYWKWRLSRPGSQYYSVLIRDREGHILGHALVTPTILRKVSALAVLDIQWINPAILPDLHKSLRDIASRFQCDVLSCMASASFAKNNSFLIAGFLKTGAVFKLIFKNLSGKFSDSHLKDEKNWHVTWIDSDDV